MSSPTEKPGVVEVRGKLADALASSRQQSAWEFALEEFTIKTDWVQEQKDTFSFNTLGMHRADVLRREIEYLRAARAAPAPTDLSKRLRASATADVDLATAMLLIGAAEEIERYYGGMIAWKRTAQSKDAHMGGVPSTTTAPATHGAVPKGCAIVPIVPTDAMVRAPGALTADGKLAHIHRSVWARMLAAAPCALPPPGWDCTRVAGHDGPCAARPVATQPTYKTEEAS